MCKIHNASVLFFVLRKGQKQILFQFFIILLFFPVNIAIVASKRAENYKKQLHGEKHQNENDSKI